MCRSVLVPCCVLFGCVLLACKSLPSSQQAAEFEAFRFNGQPIHPALVEDLLVCIADTLPTVAAVDLEGFGKSNRCADQLEPQASGFINYRSTDLHGPGYFQYRHLGHSAGGTHLLETYGNGGGTLTEHDLLFV